MAKSISDILKYAVGTYEIDAWCKNCEHHTHYEVIKRKPVTCVRCENCGCKTLIVSNTKEEPIKIPKLADDFMGGQVING